MLKYFSFVGVGKHSYGEPVLPIIIPDFLNENE